MTHAAAGWAHSLLATESARVYGFGLNRSCQIGRKKMTNVTELKRRKGS